MPLSLLFVLVHRVTSMDSGGSGNGSNHLTNADLSVANSSLNMWNVSFFVIRLWLLLLSFVCFILIFD